MKTVKLSECLSKIIDYRGKTPKKLGFEWLSSKNGYRAISANNVKFNGLQKLDSINYGDDELYNKWMKEKVLRNDLLLTSEAPAGQVMLWDSDEQIILSQRLFALRTNEKFDSKYLKYYLQSITGQAEIKKNTSGSTVFGISAKMFDQINVFDENIEVQEKIGQVLYNLDKKIKLKNKINKELEAIAKTLYDYWFVQFDFPDENNKPYKSSGGKMVYNDELKREIPEGWEVKRLGEYADIKRGELITANEACEGNIKVVAAGINYSYMHSKANRDLNTITISGSGANAGHINFWREPIFASDCTTVRGKNDTNTIMILQYLNLLQEYIYSQAKGSAQPHVYPEDIKQLHMPVAPENLTKKFGDIILPLNMKIAINEQQNQKLSKLRDWLLPMLMNGQVKVA